MIKFLQLLRRQIELATEDYKKQVELDKHEVIDETLYSDMKTTLQFLLEDVNNIRDLEVDKIIEYFYADGLETDLSIERYKDIIRQVQVITEGNISDNLGFELTVEQSSVLDSFIDTLEETLKTVDKKIVEKEARREKNKTYFQNMQTDILEYELLYDKIVGTSSDKQLDLEDFAVIEKILSGKYLKEQQKIDFMLGIKTYIDEVRKHGYMNIEGVNIEEFVKLLRDEYKFNQDMVKLVLRNKEEIKANGDLDTIKKIMSYMSLVDESINKKNILKRFDNETLLAILIYGSEDSVKNRYQSIPKGSVSENIFYTSANGWVNRISQKDSGRGTRRKGSNVLSEYQSNSRLRNKLYQLTPEEQLANAEYLESIGFNINDNYERNKRVLNTPIYRILDNYIHLNTYGLLSNRNLEEFPVCVLSMYNIPSTCDKYIEAGLYNYLYNYTSALNRNSPEFFAVLFKLKTENTNEEYFNTIYSKKNTETPCLAEGEIKSKMYEIQNLDAYLDEAGRYNEEIPNVSKYEECIYENELNTDISYTNISPALQELEEKYKINDYMYQFGDQIISRLKVIRNYSILETHGLVENESALMYSITRGSLLTEESYNKIKTVIIGEKGVGSK